MVNDRQVNSGHDWTGRNDTMAPLPFSTHILGFTFLRWKWHHIVNVRHLLVTPQMIR